jgi:uncharacterized SAM-binding protein YcdF (DUF218 family)
VPTTRDLYFWLPKLLDIVEEPLQWGLFLLILALLLFWRRRERAARRTLALAVLLFAFLGIVVVPEAILQRLENAYPGTTRSPSEFEGVLVLGGGLDGARKARERRQTLLNGSAERVTTAVALARGFPDLKFVLTGYAGLGHSAELSEAERTVKFFEAQGVPTSRLIVEPTSRNTFEIAENVKALPGIDPSRPWLLLTSAWNMPRALLAFREAGWNVEPLPVDYGTGTTVDYFQFSILTGANAWSRVLHEVLGIAWYRIIGRL